MSSPQKFNIGQKYRYTYRDHGFSDSFSQYFESIDGRTVVYIEEKKYEPMHLVELLNEHGDVEDTFYVFTDELEVIESDV